MTLNHKLLSGQKWSGRVTLPGLWNCQILLLVHRQINGQNLLVQPRFTCLIIGSFLEENIFWVLKRSASEYPQCMFSSEEIRKNTTYNLDTSLS